MTNSSALVPRQRSAAAEVPALDPFRLFDKGEVAAELVQLLQQVSDTIVESLGSRSPSSTS